MKKSLPNRQSLRLQKYDYSSPGKYFVTILAQNRNRLFGEVKEGKMYLSEIGKKADECWREIPEHFPVVKLDEYQIMPDHLHGIIEITGEKNHKEKKINHFQKMIRRSLGSIVKGFKIGVTKWCREMYPDDFPITRKIWHRNFHDRIIHSDGDLNRIRRYIRNNPQNWKGG